MTRPFLQFYDHDGQLIADSVRGLVDDDVEYIKPYLSSVTVRRKAKERDAFFIVHDRGVAGGRPSYFLVSGPMGRFHRTSREAFMRYLNWAIEDAREVGR